MKRTSPDQMRSKPEVAPRVVALRVVAPPDVAPPQVAPRVELIDARMEDLDEEALRARVRTRGAAVQAPFCSRSYCFPLALVAWHAAPVGVDIERIEPCPDGFADSISTPAERAAQASERAAQASEPAGPGRGAQRPSDRYAISLWCSKEALAKALGDPVAYDPRRLEGPGAWPEGRSGPWRTAALEVAPGYVAWLCWRVSSR